MMVNAITRLLGQFLALVTNQPSKYWQALLAVYALGLPRGYSRANLEWMCKQVALETGWGTSKGLLEDSNAWGMSRVRTRPTTQSGWRQLSDGNTLGQYDNVTDSVRDRFMWDDYWNTSELRKDPGYPRRVAERYLQEKPEYLDSVDRLGGQDARTAGLALVAIPVLGLTATGLVIKLKQT